MPYRQAHYFVGFCLLTIIVGFWGSYFTPIAQVPLAFHVHAITATVWVALLLFQHYSIHGRRRALHRLGGLLSMGLFPFLIVGFVMIINVSAERFVSGVRAELTPSFGISMVVAIAAYLILYHQALRHRRDVRLHAGYMLTTPLILFESPFSRVLLEHLPALVFTSSDFPQRIIDAIVMSIGLAIVFALVMFLRDRDKGTPFLVAAILMTVQALTMYFSVGNEWVAAFFGAYAAIPTWITLIAGFLLGAAVAWMGWSRPAGGQTNRRAATAAT